MFPLTCNAIYQSSVFDGSFLSGEILPLTTSSPSLEDYMAFCLWYSKGQNKYYKKLKVMYLSRNPDLVTQDNPKTLF